MGGIQRVEYHVGRGGAGIRMTVSKANLIVLCFVSGGMLCGVWSVKLGIVENGDEKV